MENLSVSQNIIKNANPQKVIQTDIDIYNERLLSARREHIRKQHLSKLLGMETKLD